MNLNMVNKRTAWCRRAIILITLFALIFVAYEETQATHSSISATKYDKAGARAMLPMINKFRTSSQAWEWKSNNKQKLYHKGLGKLKYDYGLEKVAIARAQEIASRFSHTRPNGKSCFTLFDAYNVNYTAAGENIAMGYTTAASVFDGWKETKEKYAGQGHRRNMLEKKFNAVGVGHVIINGRHYWVQSFAKLKSATKVSKKTTTKKTTVKATTKEPKRKSASIAKVSGVTVKSGIDQVKVKWKKTENASGYEVVTAENKAFTNKKKAIVISGSSAVNKTVKNLQSEKTCYVKVRAYTKDGSGSRVYGKYSTVKAVRVR